MKYFSLRTLGTISTVYNKIILGRKSVTFENKKYVICTKMIVSYTAKAIFKEKVLTSPVFCRVNVNIHCKMKWTHLFSTGTFD